MKETFGQRLARIRKEKGLTQEDIASKVTISPQAVSKWENDLSTPDIYVLSQLADFLGVSVDELLGREASTNKEEQKEESNEDVKEEAAEESETVDSEVVDDDKRKDKPNIHIDRTGIHVHDGNDHVDIDKTGVHIHDDEDDFEITPDNHYIHHKNKFDLVTDIISGILMGLAVIGYILMGVLWTDQTMGWKCGWVLFLLAITISSIFSAIKGRRFTRFAYPVIITAIYCFIGFMGEYFKFNGWGIYWFLFLTIPAFYLIFSQVDKIIHRNDVKVCIEEDDDDDDDDDDDKDED